MIDSQASAAPQPPGTVPPEPSPGAELPKVSARYIWLMVLAQFGVFTAFITPLAISLSVRVAELAPGHEQYLGYITGVGAAAVVVAGPLLGVLSDRTRTRLNARVVSLKESMDRGEKAEKAGIGAVLGGVLGTILGGKKGAIIGVVVGGTGGVAASKGEDVSLPAGTILVLSLERPLTVSGE